MKKSAENNDGCREIRMLTKFFCDEVHGSWGRELLSSNTCRFMPSATTSFSALYATGNPPMERRQFRDASQGREENEAQGFTQLDNRSKVVRVDAVIPSSEIAPTKQSKKRQI